MADYLEPVSRGEQLVTIIVLWVATILLSLIVFVLFGLLFQPPKPDAKPTDFWYLLAGFLFLGWMLFACVWMLVRFNQDIPPANGHTMMPLWFIRVFGVMFLAGAGLFVWEGHYLEGVLIIPFGVSMVFVHRVIRRKTQGSTDVSASGRHSGE